jgi:hypothetical protein
VHRNGESLLQQFWKMKRYQELHNTGAGIGGYGPGKVTKK